MENKTTIQQYKKGMKVNYTSHGRIENGIIKSINDNQTIAWVVYKCDNEWSNYEKYVGAATNIEDLSIGWKPKKCFNCKFAGEQFKVGGNTSLHCLNQKLYPLDDFNTGKLSPWDSLMNWYSTCKSHEFKLKKNKTCSLLK